MKQELCLCLSHNPKGEEENIKYILLWYNKCCMHVICLMVDRKSILKELLPGGERLEICEASRGEDG